MNLLVALNGDLDPGVMPYQSHPVFGLAIPGNCPGVPAPLLNPRDTWTDATAYDRQAERVWALFEAKRNEFN